MATKAEIEKMDMAFNRRRGTEITYPPHDVEYAFRILKYAYDIGGYVLKHQGETVWEDNLEKPELSEGQEIWVKPWITSLFQCISKKTFFYKRTQYTFEKPTKKMCADCVFNEKCRAKV